MATTKKEATKPTTKTAEPTFDKDGLLASSGFTATEKAILRVVLKHDETYTLTGVNKLIKEFKGGI